MATKEMVNVTKLGSVAVMAINRPSALNALNRQVLSELRIQLRRAEEDETVRVIVITGEGDKAFAAGADIAEFTGITDPDAGRAYSVYGQETFSMIECVSKPVIAAMNGYALGGGLELALACDIRIASDRVKLGFPEITLGVLPGFGGTQRAMRLIGKGAALRLMWTGEMLGSDEALRLGLIDRVCQHESLKSEVLDFAQKIARQSPSALSAIKDCVARDLTAESEHFGRLIVSEQARELCSVFLNKRK